MNPRDLRYCIVRPVLRAMLLWSHGAEELVMATANNASGLSRLIAPGGRLAAGHDSPADDEPVGLWGITPRQHRILIEWLHSQPESLTELVLDASEVARMDENNLLGNLCYGAAVCRAWYLRAEIDAGLQIPGPIDLRELARAWAQHWLADTASGYPSVEQFAARGERMRVSAAEVW